MVNERGLAVQQLRRSIDHAPYATPMACSPRQTPKMGSRPAWVRPPRRIPLPLQAFPDPARAGCRRNRAKIGTVEAQVVIAPDIDLGANCAKYWTRL